MSKILLVSMEIAATKPFKEEYSLCCQLPSADIVTLAKFFSEQDPCCTLFLDVFSSFVAVLIDSSAVFLQASFRSTTSLL